MEKSNINNRGMLYKIIQKYIKDWNVMSGAAARTGTGNLKIEIVR